MSTFFRVPGDRRLQRIVTAGWFQSDQVLPRRPSRLMHRGIVGVPRPRQARRPPCFVGLIKPASAQGPRPTLPTGRGSMARRLSLSPRAGLRSRAASRWFPRAFALRATGRQSLVRADQELLTSHLLLELLLARQVGDVLRRKELFVLVQHGVARDAQAVERRLGEEAQAERDVFAHCWSASGQSSAAGAASTLAVAQRLKERLLDLVEQPLCMGGWLLLQRRDGYPVTTSSAWSSLARTRPRSARRWAAHLRAPWGACRRTWSSSRRRRWAC